MFLLVFLLGLSTEAAQLPRMEKLGPAQVPVFFQSKNVKLIKKTSRGELASARVILRWGTQVYEVGNLIFLCRNTCEMHDYQYLATYEKCSISKGKARCYGRISGSDDGGGPDFSSDRRLRMDDWDAPTPDSLDEFPERYHDDDFYFDGGI